MWILNKKTNTLNKTSSNNNSLQSNLGSKFLKISQRILSGHNPFKVSGQLQDVNHSEVRNNSEVLATETIPAYSETIVLTVLMNNDVKSIQLFYGLIIFINLCIQLPTILAALK